jgi:hypothetical protein
VILADPRKDPGKQTGGATRAPPAEGGEILLLPIEYEDRQPYPGSRLSDGPGGSGG